jgi:lipopolysaccharide heptosyltransferase I
VKSILIVKLGSIGDIVHTLPALAALRRTFAGVRIDWLVETRCRDILLDNPALDELIEVDTLRWRRRLHSAGTWKEIAASLRRLRGRRYDVVFDFQGLVKSGLMAWLARSPRRIGFERGRLRESFSAVFTNEWIAVPFERGHVIDKNLSLLKAVGIDTREREFPIEVPGGLDEKASRALDELDLSDDFVIINPGGGWVTKIWDPKRYGELASEIKRLFDLPSLVLWGPGEDALARSVVASSGGAAQMAPPTELRDLIPYVRRARLFVGGDTGPLHIASALRVPVVALFGPSDPVQNGPFWEEDLVVWKSVACSPCYKRRCPGFGTVCLTSMEVPEVLDAVRRRLAGNQDIKT